MRRTLLSCLSLVALVFQSCVTVAVAGLELREEMQEHVYYLGEHASPTEELDVYFDQFGVGKEYVVVGTITNQENNRYKTTDYWKDAFIECAKREGGEGIIFEPIQVSFNPDCNKCLLLNAKVIRYKPEKEK